MNPSPSLPVSSSPSPSGWILRYLICNAGINGQCHLDERTLTSWDAFHACQAYICKNKAEWDRRAKDNVAKDKKRFWMAVELYQPETKERRKVDDLLRFELVNYGMIALVEGSAGTPARSDLTAQYTLDCIKATLQSYAGLPASAANLQECLDRITNAVRGTVVQIVGRSAPVVQLPVPSIPGQTFEIKQQDPAGAHDSGAEGSPPSPATISPQTDSGTSQSGNTGEAAVEAAEVVEVSGTTLSEQDLETGGLGDEETPIQEPKPESAGTLEDTEPASKPDIDTGSVSAGDDSQGARPVVKSAPAPAKPKPPAKKAAKAKK